MEKDAVIDAVDRGSLGQTAQEKLLADIDAQLLRHESEETDDRDNVAAITAESKP